MGLRRYQPIGVPIVLAHSAVAVPLTGSTDETALATIAIPANAMGSNGRLRVSFQVSWPNNGNNKTVRLRYSGGSGTIYVASTGTTSLSFQAIVYITNRNATDSQVGGVNQIGTVSTGAPVTSSVDTTEATSLVITGQLANGADTITLESRMVELIRGD